MDPTKAISNGKWVGGGMPRGNPKGGSAGPF